MFKKARMLNGTRRFGGRHTENPITLENALIMPLKMSGTVFAGI